MCGAKSSTASRVGYALLFLVTSILSYLVENRRISCFGYGCAGIVGVYRVCFASTLFHLILSISLWNVKNSSDWRAGIQNGFWGIKMLVYIVLIGLAMAIPDAFYYGLGTFVNMPGASLFIFIQMLLLIDFAYSASEQLLALWEENEDKRYLGLLIIITFGSFISSIVLTGFLYAWFASGPCHLNQAFISVNLAICFLVSVTAVLPAVQEANPQSGLAQAAMVTIYATYLVTSAITSEPPGPNGDVTCNPFIEGGKAQTTTILLGSFFTFIALAYSTSTAAVQNMVGEETRPLLQSSHLQDAVEAGALPTSALDVEQQDSVYPSDDEKDAVLYNYSFFHFIFTIASMYLAMMVTNWDNAEDEYGVVKGKNMAAVWVKIVSSWLALLLYAWTLIAPLVWTERDWE